MKRFLNGILVTSFFVSLTCLCGGDKEKPVAGQITPLSRVVISGENGSSSSLNQSDEKFKETARQFMENRVAVFTQIERHERNAKNLKKIGVVGVLLASTTMFYGAFTGNTDVMRAGSGLMLGGLFCNARGKQLLEEPNCLDCWCK